MIVCERCEEHLAIARVKSSLAGVVLLDKKICGLCAEYALKLGLEVTELEMEEQKKWPVKRNHLKTKV